VYNVALNYVVFYVVAFPPYLLVVLSVSCHLLTDPTSGYVPHFQSNIDKAKGSVTSAAAAAAAAVPNESSLPLDESVGTEQDSGKAPQDNKEPDE
jgi:hypothetical protein